MAGGHSCGGSRRFAEEIREGVEHRREFPTGLPWVLAKAALQRRGLSLEDRVENLNRCGVAFRSNRPVADGPANGAPRQRHPVREF